MKLSEGIVRMMAKVRRSVSGPGTSDGAGRTARRAVLLALAAWCLGVMSAGTVKAAELVMFDSPGCPWCARWREEVGPGYPKSDEGRRAPLRVHAMAESDTSGVRLKAPVTASPTFVLVDKGNEVGRIVGYPGADFFWGLLAQMLAKLDRASKLSVP